MTTVFRTRREKIFSAALISIIIGAAFLKAIGGNPSSAGAFSLSQYQLLKPAEELVSCHTVPFDDRWASIEIYYSRPQSKNSDSHFIIWNGVIGGNGQIQPTQKWQKQIPIQPRQTHSGSEYTIRICVSADSKTTHPTDFQIKSTESLVKALSRKFDIQQTSITLPQNWW